MALLFDANAHEYFLDGQLMPSVTQILRDQGLIDLRGIPAFILEAARQRGSAVHQLVHYLNEDDLDWSSVSDAYRGYVDAWIRYRDETNLRVLLCEHRLASRRHKVTGTLDLLCEIDGVGWIIDYKTGDPALVSADLQTAGYLGLAMEWAVDDSRLADVLNRHQRWRRGAVRLRRTGTFQAHEYTDPRDYSRFQVLTAAWHIRQQRGVAMSVDELEAA